MSSSSAASFSMDVLNCTGMVADGKRDMSAAVQKCVQHCISSSDCSALYFAAGRYLLRSTVYLDHDDRPSGAPYMTIRGSGRGTELIWSPATGNCLEFVGKEISLRDEVIRQKVNLI